MASLNRRSIEYVDAILEGKLENQRVRVATDSCLRARSHNSWYGGLQDLNRALVIEAKALRWCGERLKEKLDSYGTTLKVH